VRRCFYLDTPENARKNRMTVKTKQEKVISETYVILLYIQLMSSGVSHSFSDISKSIVANGGKIVDLDNPKLTHILLDKRDDSRRISLMQYTSK
jgi:DNA ligase-4